MLVTLWVAVVVLGADAGAAPSPKVEALKQFAKTVTDERLNDYVAFAQTRLAGVRVALKEKDDNKRWAALDANNRAARDAGHLSEEDAESFDGVVGLALCVPDSIEVVARGAKTKKDKAMLEKGARDARAQAVSTFGAELVERVEKRRADLTESCRDRFAHVM